jgi:hypothetical protein
MRKEQTVDVPLFIGKDCVCGYVWKGQWCEHCGDLEERVPVISDGGTWWCEDCWYSIVGEFTLPLGIDEVE